MTMSGEDRNLAWEPDVAHLVSADWSKFPAKRAVYSASTRERRIRRYTPRGGTWSVESLLEVATELAREGPVLVGVDVVLGVPQGYWELVRQPRSSGVRQTFVDWLGDQPDRFFETADGPEDWDSGRPWFQVAAGTGGLTRFTDHVEGGMRRATDSETGGMPVFAVSGVPGVVGSGTRAFWRELAPLLCRDRNFAVWPFESDQALRLSERRIVMCESYPRLAYAVALAEELPTVMVTWPKTKKAWRGLGCDCLKRVGWVGRHGVELGDLARARADEDDFDALFVAAAVLRCVLEKRPLWRGDRVDGTAEGSMLLTGVLEVGGGRGADGKQPKTGFKGKEMGHLSFLTT